jgi:hypothetical protein
VKTIRHGLITAIGVVLAGLVVAPPTAAHVAEVTTSVPLAAVADADSLRRTIGEAVDRARAETIAFVPSVVVVTGVRVLGERVLIGLLFADDEGEAMLETLHDSAGGDRRRDDDGPGVDGTAAPGELRI